MSSPVSPSPSRSPRSHVRVLDTTLRDGEQSPGASMSRSDKVEIARQLEAMQVDVIEAGFPISSAADHDSVHAIASNVSNATVAALARAVAGDIDSAASALRGAAAPRIHIVIATSPLHRKHKLGKNKAQVLEAIRASVEQARNYAADVQWSAEDASRTEPEFLCRAVEAAIKAGASTINLPDTVGYALPHEYRALFRNLLERVPGADEVVLSAHCHDDLGLAVANSLAALEGGARQVECSVNGLGERAGNTPLEEVVMALRTRSDQLAFDTQVVSEGIAAVSALVARASGFSVQPNKAVVGANAFAHASGIHQDGVLKHAATYEIMTPASVGVSSNSIVLSRHSGRHALRERLRALACDISDEAAFSELYQRFLALAAQHKCIDDEVLLAMYRDATPPVPA